MLIFEKKIFSIITKIELLYLLIDVNKAAEVCQWGLLANELNEPTYDICMIVAVALKDQKSLRQTASSSSSGTSVSSSYSNYDCPKIPIGNMAELEIQALIDPLDKKVAQRALICPRITINDPSTRERITLERFLIADGDYHQNSIFVFGFSNIVGEMNLMFYLNDIFKINQIKVSTSNVENFQNVLHNLEQKIKLNELCNTPITERQNVCKYSAMRKFSNDDKVMDLQEDDFDFDATHLDMEGFVPYRCYVRFSSLRLGFAKLEDHIYCPSQVIRVGDSVMLQDGFFYSISNDVYEKRIHLKETVFPSHRDDHRIKEKTVLPFPNPTDKKP